MLASGRFLIYSGTLLLKMTENEIRKALENPLYDSGILRHGFARFGRDYDVVVAAREDQFLYRFSHCTSVTITTSVSDQNWRKSWKDIYTDYSAWEGAGCPEGHVWGVRELDAYPGGRYINGSMDAEEWAIRLGKPMHEVRIETNGHNFNLIFHDLIVRELSETDEEWVAVRTKT